MNRNHRKTRARRWYALVVGSMALLALLSGCATTTPVERVNAPRVPQAMELKRVAVYPFHGSKSSVFREEFENLLFNSKANGKPVYSVIESSRLDDVLRAQRLGPIYDERTIVEVGRLVGANGIFVGSVLNNAVDSNRYPATMQKCSFDKDGKCIWRDYRTSCTKRTANVAMTVRLINVTTGVQVYNGKADGSVEDTHCRGESRAPVDDNTLLRTAREAAFDKVRRDIAPYVVNYKVTLLDDEDGITRPTNKAKLKAGLAFAKAGRMDRACELWREAGREEPNSLSLTYNLGVCAEVEGALTSAKGYYRRADKMLMAPNPAVDQALRRTGAI